AGPRRPRPDRRRGRRPHRAAPARGRRLLLMKVPRSIYEEMLEHAREEAPNECCGILGGRGDEAATLYRATNAEASPLRYTLDPNDLFRITFREIPENDEEMLAIYHSHTASPAYPSQTDINLATYPDS